MVNVVMANLTGCNIGSDCRHGDGIGEAGAQKWMARVIAQLQLRGLCAGQHETGVTDEIAVATKCDGPWEGYHVANFGGGKVVWSPNAARPTWTPQSGCSATPPPTPLPTPTPGPVPTPSPTPVPGACPVPVPGPLARFDAKVHVQGPNWTTLDSTPLVGPDAAFCAAIGYTDGRRYCPPRAEGGTDIQACNELVVGVYIPADAGWPKWFWNDVFVPVDGLTEGVAHDANPYHLLLRPSLHGTAKVCGQNGVCGAVTR